MTDAASGLARWVLENFPADEVLRLEAAVFSSNGGSQRVVTKAGFVHEGTRRKAGVQRWDGGVVDILVFGLLREDLKAEGE
jgi:[ribosomal protein S5]-alanine N-acetyltransferase